MRDHIISLTRFHFVVSIALFTVGFIGAWSFGLGFFGVFIGLPIIGFTALGMTVSFLVSGIKIAPEVSSRPWRFAVCAAAPGFLAAITFLALPLFWTGSYVGSFTRLMVNWNRYEAIVADVRANPKAAWFEETNGVTYSVDLGPPIRIAFNPEGLLDNWSGMVYDPTGDVMMADGFDRDTGEFVAPQRITKLFEGDLVGCRRLWRDYYVCSFT